MTPTQHSWSETSALSHQSLSPLCLPSRESLTHQTALSFPQYQIPQPYSSTTIHTEIISLQLSVFHNIKPPRNTGETTSRKP